MYLTFLTVRLVLATCNVIGFAYWRRSLADRYGRRASFLFVLLTISQFHVPFWIGRTLPNMFALLPGMLAWPGHLFPLSHCYMLPVNIALCKLWDRAPNATRPTHSGMNVSIALLVFAGVVFRSEVALLLAPIVLQALWCGYAPLTRIIKVGLVSALASIGTLFKLHFTPLTDLYIVCSNHCRCRFVFLATVASLA